MQILCATTCWLNLDGTRFRRYIAGTRYSVADSAIIPPALFDILDGPQPVPTPPPVSIPEPPAVVEVVNNGPTQEQSAQSAIDAQPVAVLDGLGAAHAKGLAAEGIYLVGDLRKALADPDTVQRLLQSEHLHVGRKTIDAFRAML